MTEEFNLSDKKENCKCEEIEESYVYQQKDVREFIRLLKEMKGIVHDGSFIEVSVFRKFIDKLVGEKFI